MRCFQEWYDDYVDVLKDITNLSLFNELHFFLLGVSTIIMCIWFVVPYFYLPVHMTSSGYTENQASFALSLIGFTNIAGMVSSPTLVYRWMDNLFSVGLWNHRRQVKRRESILDLPNVLWSNLCSHDVLYK